MQLRIANQVWLGGLCAAVFLALPHSLASAQLADVRLTMSHSPESVTLGASQNLSFTISVNNGGPSTATNVTLTDVLDPSFVFGFATVSPPSQGSCSEAAGTVTCNLNAMAPAVGATITIQVTPNAASASISNTASVTADQLDPNPANNSATNAVTILGANSDLRVTMSHSPDSVTLGAGQNLNYTISAANNGPSTATTVTLVDVLDQGFIFNFATVSPPSQGNCSEAGGTVTCNLNAMTSGSGANITIQVSPTTDAASIANTASISADQPDPNLANNTATNSTTVKAPISDMRLTMSHSPDPVTLGQNLSYLLSVTNGGPSTATNATLSDTLPPGVSFVTATVSPISQGSCNEAAGTVTCNFNPFDPGAGANVTIVVTPGAPGTITNAANVVADQPDPNPANNSASNDTTTVTGPPLPTDADLRVSQSHSPDPATLGSDQFIQYTISVNNSGPAAATGVTLTDSLAPNMSFAGYSLSPPTQGICASSAGVVTCNLNTLDVGSGANVTIYASPSAPDAVVPNTVNVTADQNDPNPGNNSATNNITINAPNADVRVTMSHSPEPITLGAGQFLQYLISMVNGGPSPATAGTIVDMLPGNVTFAGFSLSPATQGSCNQLLGTVTCDLNPLASGVGVNLTIFATPNADAPVVGNTVSVGASEPDFNPANNSATDNVAILAANADLRVTMSHSPDPATVGGLLQYLVSITNGGPSPATNVSLTDVLDPSLSFAGVSVSPATQGICGQVAGTVSCSLNTLTSGAGVNVTIYVIATMIADDISNTANVSATEPDPIFANNFATNDVTVTSSTPQGILVANEEPTAVKVGETGKKAVFTIDDLGPLSGQIRNSVGNASGQSVGYSVNADGQTHAVIYSGETRTDLGTLGGANSYALGINSSGLVVGQSETAQGEVHAFLFSNGKLQDLGTLGGKFSAAWAVSDSGLVVGSSSIEGGYNHAFLYRLGRMTDLNGLIAADAGWDLKLAWGFDRDGHIVGQGTISGEEHMFRLTPLESASLRRSRK